jgi:hypothetical protein
MQEPLTSSFYHSCLSELGSDTSFESLHAYALLSATGFIGEIPDWHLNSDFPFRKRHCKSYRDAQKIDISPISTSPKNYGHIPSFNTHTMSLPKTYKHAIFKEHGQPLVVEEASLKLPGPGELLVKVEACGVCFSDMFAQINVMGGGLYDLPTSSHHYTLTETSIVLWCQATRSLERWPR